MTANSKPATGEITVLREALEKIATSTIPDLPGLSSWSALSIAERHIETIREIAVAALDLRPDDIAVLNELTETHSRVLTAGGSRSAVGDEVSQTLDWEPYSEEWPGMGLLAISEIGVYLAFEDGGWQSPTSYHEGTGQTLESAKVAAQADFKETISLKDQ